MLHRFKNSIPEDNNSKRNQRSDSKEDKGNKSKSSKRKNFHGDKRHQYRTPQYLKRNEKEDEITQLLRRESMTEERMTEIIKLRPFLKQSICRLIEVPASSLSSEFDSSESLDDILLESKCHINDSQLKDKILLMNTGNFEDNLNKSLLETEKLKRSESLDISLLDELKRLEISESYQRMLTARKKLPAFERRNEILDMINSNQVVAISGETGCGKSTQVAQFILDHEIKCKKGSITHIACTQPRRISAVSVAERVAAERGDSLGNSVGFCIRLEKVISRPQGSILFCTTAMLLQFMKTDPALKNYSHIILDEIHERNTESDFLITLLKHVIPKRPDLKLVLMSATLNSDQFSKYYNNCPMIHIPGFAYPVKEFYLEDILTMTNFRFPSTESKQNNISSKKNIKAAFEKLDNLLEIIKPYICQLESLNTYPSWVLEELKKSTSEQLSFDLILVLIKYICLTEGPGAILIFLPGIMDISELNNKLEASTDFPKDKYVIYPLHSKLPTVDQKIIFKVPPKGVRKIIIATTTAETSITIEDVVYVIDSGKTKLSRFDVANNLQTLNPEWISEANARQRKGRAGRVQPGICYHLYTKARAHTFDKYPLPEMLRTRLEEIILQAKLLQVGKVTDFLAKVMDPPDTKAISLSLDLLRQLNALDEMEHLTPLGYHLAQLPLDPRTGKMLIWAAMFSCVEPVFSIAASLAFKDAFFCPLGKEEEAKKKKLELGMNQFSDHIALAEALKRFEKQKSKKAQYSFCWEYFLSWNTLTLLSDLKKQFADYLHKMKFLRNKNPSDEFANRYSHNKSLVKAIVCAGLYPNIAVVEEVSGKGITAMTPVNEKVYVHTTSINRKIVKFPSPYLIYYFKQKSTAIFLFDTTCVSPLALLFASSTNPIDELNGKSVFTVAENLSFFCEPSSAQIIQKLREQLNLLLERKISHPGTVNWNSHEGYILTAIIEVLSEGDAFLGLDSGRYQV